MEGPHLSAEVQLRAAATAAFSNAESILEDVRLLYAADRWARSVSLSIIGKEELGKSVIYAVAALDRLPGLRDLLASADFDNPTRDHQFKQLAAEMASIVHFMLEDLIFDSDGWLAPRPIPTGWTRY